MMDEGKLLGPNFTKRLAHILPWAEQQMGVADIRPPRPTPQVYQPSDVKIRFKAKVDIPAYGVIAPYLYDVDSGLYEGQLEGDETGWNLTCDAITTQHNGQYALPIAARMLFINGSSEVKEGEKGWCYAASEKPRWALLNSESVSSNQSGHYLRYTGLGPVPGSFELHAGLPGFAAMGPFQALGDTTLALVIRDHNGGGWAKAESDWEDPASGMPYVDANPVSHWQDSDAYGYFVYDGVDSEPEITIRIWLPRNDTGRDPNIKTGNILGYRPHLYSDRIAGEHAGFIATGDYLDDKIGTVKYWSGAVGNIPQGWRVFADIDDGDFIRHYDTVAGGSGTFGGTGVAYGYYGLIAIERFE